MHEALSLYGCKNPRKPPAPKSSTTTPRAGASPKGNQSLDVLVAAPEDYQTDVYLEDQVRNKKNNKRCEIKYQGGVS